MIYLIAHLDAEESFMGIQTAYVRNTVTLFV